MELQLRPYQQEAVSAVLNDWGRHDSVLVVAATGSGKTQILLSILLDHVLGSNERGLILVHRLELATQPLERIRQFWPAWTHKTGIVMANQNECDRQLTIATVQTLAQPHRLAKLLWHGAIDYVVRDEAHHACSPTDLQLIESLKAANPNLKLLGVTATPIRADGDGLKKVYQKVSYKAGIKELINMGYLVPFTAIGVQTAVSLNGVKSRDGDYLQKQLADVWEVDNNLDLVVESHKRWATDRQAIAFTVSVEGAHRLAKKFDQAGITAKAVDGTTPKQERTSILNDFKAGRIKVLCNCAVLTEGFDAPATAAIHMVRPTKSDSLYVQCIGRGLRTADGKTNCTIIDYAPVDARNIVLAGDLLGKPRAQKKLEEQAAKQGLLIEGFTFAGGEGTGIDGDVEELIARPLNYLTQSPFTWAFDEGYSALGLGEDDRGTKRTLIIAPPNGQPHFHLYGVRKAKDGAEEVMPLGTGDFEELAEKARIYIDKYGIGVLVSKDRGWQREPITDGQMKMLRWLAKGEGERVKGLSKGAAARLITIRMARKSLEKAGIC